MNTETNEVCIRQLSTNRDEWFDLDFDSWWDVLEHFNDAEGFQEYIIVDVEGPMSNVIEDLSASRAFEVAEHLGPYMDYHIVEYISEVIGNTSDYLKDPDGIATQCQDRFRGVYDEKTDYIHEFLEDAGALASVPDWLICHIDYDSIVRSWEHGELTFIKTKDFRWLVFS